MADFLVVTPSIAKPFTPVLGRRLHARLRDPYSGDVPCWTAVTPDSNGAPFPWEAAAQCDVGRECGRR